MIQIIEIIVTWTKNIISHLGHANYSTKFLTYEQILTITKFVAR
jgi:hypothetical protein